MSLALLLLGGVAMMVTAAFVVSVRTEPSLAAEHTAVGLGDPAAETVIGDHITPCPVGTDWQLAAVDNLSDAEDLLDCLESRGFEHRELVVLGNASFAVRWR